MTNISTFCKPFDIEILVLLKKTNDSDIDKWDEENPEISTLDRGSGLSISDEEEETRTAGFSDTYELGKSLGEGAFSIVKEGTMKNVASSSFAIKIVDKTSILEAEEARLGEEIALLKDVNHENILCLHKVYDEPQAYYLVSDIMHGGDLLTRLNHIVSHCEICPRCRPIEGRKTQGRYQQGLSTRSTRPNVPMRDNASSEPVAL